MSEMANQGDTTPVYPMLTIDQIYNQMNLILEELKKYVDSIPYLEFEKDIIVNYALLGEAVIRIDKRKYYFKVFHKEMEINENKEAALWAYWSVKFKIFRINTKTIENLTQEQKMEVEHFNEAFAVFVIFSAVAAEALTKHCDFYINPEYANRLVYAFRYWHLNKSAFMTIADSLCAHMKMESEEDR